MCLFQRLLGRLRLFSGVSLRVDILFFLCFFLQLHSLFCSCLRLSLCCAKKLWFLNLASNFLNGGQAWERCSSPLSLPSLLSLKSVFPYIATVAETRFSTTVAIVATARAIIWKPGLSNIETCPVVLKESFCCFVYENIFI